MVILGLNAYHGDAAAALLVDGEVVAAAEEERFSRAKHQAGFPAQAARWCLEYAGVGPRDLDHVAIGRDPSKHLYQKALYAITHRPGKMLRDRLANARRVVDLRRAVGEALGVRPEELRAAFHRVEHHRAHLASAFFCSPFAGEAPEETGAEPTAVLSVDGMGDFVSTMWGLARGSRIEVDGHVGFPHSLGIYYTAFTQFLGLPSYGDEYKLMGLAAYGEPRFLGVLREVLRLEDGLQVRLDLRFFRHHADGVDMTWDQGTPVIGPLWSPRMEEAFGPPRPHRGEVTERDADLAASVQARLEEVLLEMLRRLARTTGARRLAMAGGVALNCVVNGKIREQTPFEEVWVQPAAVDAGISIGSALWVWHEVLGRPQPWRMDHAYLGAAYSDAECLRALRAAGLEPRSLPDHELLPLVAAALAEGKVVGWFQGRMEFGPRALGNRSILADPRRADMKDILNARVKHRETFRPFAPSVLAEATGEWFEDSYPSPFMCMAYRVRPSRRAQIPAVTHGDGTGRLQTVEEATNPRFYRLIQEFDRLTGVPVLLNTSFNENEPIVMRPEEAVDCFLRTHMDLLVLGNHVVARDAAGSPPASEVSRAARAPATVPSDEA